MRLSILLEKRGEATQLARRMGVSVSTVTRIARGETDPSAAMIKRICEATGGKVQPNDFFDIEDT